MLKLQLENISYAIGNRDLLKDVNLKLGNRDRIALLGINGSGKSTLLKILAGELLADSGNLVPAKNLLIAYLAQSVAFLKSRTVLEEAIQAFANSQLRKSRLDKLATDLELEPENAELLEEFGLLQNELEEADFYNHKLAAKKILSGLGFSQTDLERTCNQLSGGWQMRVALAKILLAKPDLLLLDEPTNYLDLEARVWLEGFLNKYEGTIMLVSHDRKFLDALCSSTAELSQGYLRVRPGNYSSYERLKHEEEELILARYKKQQSEIMRNEQFISRFRATDSKARLVQSRVRMLERMEQIELPPNLKSFEFTLPKAIDCQREVLSIERLSRSFGAKIVLKDLYLSLQRGEKIAVAGVNAAGKSTLLKILAGRDQGFDGLVKWAKDAKVAYFSQEHQDSLNLNNTVYEEIAAVSKTDIIPNIRRQLGSFLFAGDDIYKPIKILSGGEKSRLALLKMVVQPVNVLILDEPTNHLDLQSKASLLKALQNYNGLIIFVSHDRFFIEQLAQGILELRVDSSNFYYAGDYNYYTWKKEEEELAALSSKPESGSARENSSPKESTKLKSYKDDKRLRNQEKKLKTREAYLRTSIEELEKKQARLTEALNLLSNYSNPEKARELNMALSQVAAEIDSLMLEWSSS